MSLVGYATSPAPKATRSSTAQLDALDAAGCERVFEDHVSGATSDRPNLAACLD